MVAALLGPVLAALAGFAVLRAPTAPAPGLAPAAADEPAGAAGGVDIPRVEAPVEALVSAIETASAPADVTELAPAAPTRAESASLPPLTHGLRISNAVAGNPFDLRSGDVVLDLCDQAGAETALEMSNALATDAATCLLLMRDGALVRATLDVEGGPPMTHAVRETPRVQGPDR